MMKVRKGLQGKARKMAIGVGMGALLTLPVATMVSTTAGATAPSTCYVACSSPSTGLPVTSGDGTAAATVATVSPSTSTPSGLAFTGADISELVVISVGALGAGTVLVRFSRRRRTA